jgi:hypothetical protein
MRLAIGHADEHEAAATKIARLGMHHCQCESNSHRGVDSVAARPHHLQSSP